MNLEPFFKNAKNASKKTASLRADEKKIILYSIADELEKQIPKILEENLKDIAEGELQNLGSMIDRLRLTPERIINIANDVRSVSDLQDFVGEIVSENIRPNGLSIQQIRVPFGVVAIVYESRPNVTVDSTVLALKSGNALVLKGGKEAKFSNRVLVQIMRKVLEKYGIADALQLLDEATREDTKKLLHARGKIDVLIPRGGKGLINFVIENAKIPVIETGASVVHTFIDDSANLEMAKNIVLNEKTRRVSVCNALDTLLIHENIAKDFLNIITEDLEKLNIEIHADPFVFALMGKKSHGYIPIQEDDYDTEWLDYKMSLKVVKNINEALNHIEKHSLGHSESIVTENTKNAEQFLRAVDSACVYHNTSTAFSDGAQFGLGAEMGISTQKLHARGPFALQALTTTKWIVRGNGQIRE